MIKYRIFDPVRRVQVSPAPVVDPIIRIAIAIGLPEIKASNASRPGSTATPTRCTGTTPTPSAWPSRAFSASTTGVVCAAACRDPGRSGRKAVTVHRRRSDDRSASVRGREGRFAAEARLHGAARTRRCDRRFGTGTGRCVRRPSDGTAIRRLCRRRAGAGILAGILPSAGHPG